MKTMRTTITNEMEFNRFGFISAIILIVGCLGGLTVGMGAIENGSRFFSGELTIFEFKKWSGF
jgi:hypothetical protein